MPKSYLDLQPHPNVSVNDWLTWPVSKLVLSIINDGSKIAGLIVINKAGDLQYIFMPTVVLKALGDAMVVLGNSTNLNSKPSLVYVDAPDLGFISVVETFTKLPDKICPEEHLPSKFMKGTSWENANVPLGLACFPIFAPIFFSAPSKLPSMTLTLMKKLVLFLGNI
jgi:hypothetical protein